MRIIKQSIPLIIGFLMMAGSVFAQVKTNQNQTSQPDSISDSELSKFVAVATEIQKLQQESKETVDSLLEGKEMDSRRFSEIMMSKNNPQSTDSANVTPQEQETIDEIRPKLKQMQQKSQKQLASAIQDKGLTPQRFQQIGKAVRTNPEVRKRFQSMISNSIQK